MPMGMLNVITFRRAWDLKGTGDNRKSFNRCTLPNSLASCFLLRRLYGDELISADISTGQITGKSIRNCFVPNRINHNQIKPTDCLENCWNEVGYWTLIYAVSLECSS